MNMLNIHMIKKKNQAIFLSKKKRESARFLNDNYSSAREPPGLQLESIRTSKASHRSRICYRNQGTMLKNSETTKPKKQNLSNLFPILISP